MLIGLELKSPQTARSAAVRPADDALIEHIITRRRCEMSFKQKVIVGLYR